MDPHIMTTDTRIRYYAHMRHITAEEARRLFPDPDYTPPWQTWPDVLLYQEVAEFEAMLPSFHIARAFGVAWQGLDADRWASYRHRNGTSKVPPGTTSGPTR